MSGFLLDTNVPSELLRSRPDFHVTAWIKAQAKETLFASVITLGELRRGVALLGERSSRRQELERVIYKKVPVWFADRILPVTREIAERWGELDAAQQRSGQPLNIADGLLAATALQHDLTIVTRNVKDFAALGIRILNPWDES